MSQTINECLAGLIAGNTELQLALGAAGDLESASDILARAAQANGLQVDGGQTREFLAAQLSPGELEQIAAGRGGYGSRFSGSGYGLWVTPATRGYQGK